MEKKRSPFGWLTALGLSGLLVALALIQGTGFPLGLGLALTTLAGWLALPLLRELKIQQVIRVEGPTSHRIKSGTPTMGGAFWIPVAVVLGFIWNANPSAQAVCVLTLSYGLVGFWDDWLVITSQPGGKRGMSARLKLLLLSAAGILFCFYLAFVLWSGILDQHTMVLDWQAQPWIPLGLLFWPLALFVLVGTSNAVNLTDGLDGLASGTAAIAAACLGLLVGPDLAPLCWIMTGCCLGFLVFNHNPAKVFMGDTGSLALGGFLGSVALLSGELLAMLLAGGVFVIEACSVMAQISYYKATKGPDGKGKRLLRMAPLHHHFELSGWNEVHIVTFFYSLALALAVGAVLLRG